MNRNRMLALVLALAASPAAPQQGGDRAPIPSKSRVSVPAGSSLHTRPSIAAPVVTIVDDRAAAELIEERDGWKRVRIGMTTGWLPPEGTSRARRPGDATVDTARLSEALRRLPKPVTTVEAAGVALNASGADAERLERWARVADHMLSSWPRRLGIEPPDLDGAAVVFVPDDEAGAENPATPGSTSGGVAIVHTGGDREDDEIEALLVHELSHLASERAFPRGLPIWLEEGIAEWMAREPLASDGYGLPGLLRGEVAVSAEGAGRRIDYIGPLADLVRLGREAKSGRLPALDAWTATPEAAFSASTERSSNYALAGSFARFLFESDETRAATVREVLERASTVGADVDAELDRRLGDVGTLDAAFREWLVDEMNRQIVPAEG